MRISRGSLSGRCEMYSGCWRNCSWLRLSCCGCLGAASPGWRKVSLGRRTIIPKLHGQVGRSADDREWESFVVTEDDYIEYLAQAEVASVVPVALGAKLRRSHFLFLGYTMADWNLRLLLHRLWGDQPLSYRSWAVQPEPMPIEREFWRRRDVDVLEIPLERYVAALARQAGLELTEAPA